MREKKPARSGLLPHTDSSDFKTEYRRPCRRNRWPLWRRLVLLPLQVGLQALCVATAAVVGSPAVKAMITQYNTGGIKAMTDEQRDELAAKLSNRHE